jgi:CRP/FNR family cyclic AMP-dependent transcriptional regulator
MYRSPTPQAALDAAPGLTPGERDAIEGDRWFASLAPCDRHDLLRHAKVVRYATGELISSRGSLRPEWYACAAGTVRIGGEDREGRATALTYVRAGVWFGDPGLFDGGRGTHDAHAYGPATVLSIPRGIFTELLANSNSLCGAVLRLQARHVRELYQALEDGSSLTLRPRLARQLVSLAHRHGAPASGGGTRITLNLRQSELAQLLASSRQRVNMVLKNMERSGFIRVERTGIVVCDTAGLQRLDA